jgi:4-hydroxybenzoate polyprenyltransferase
MLWTAGFDVIYSLQDEEFDRDNGLRSLPETLGRTNALWVSRLCHFASVALLSLSVVLNGGGTLAFAGVAFAAVLLAYEQSLVRPDDLSRVNMAFFTLNGFVSLGFFLFVLADVVMR